MICFIEIFRLKILKNDFQSHECLRPGQSRPRLRSYLRNVARREPMRSLLFKRNCRTRCNNSP